ncbi:hypothetical protein [Paenibacillus ehimensis]|uniref:hypothetical protein n=1 Tax=Paenibacillus ehimensis TaxID=79264 RepID=UPI00046E6733|nr:hypothetical protein [Paenibacillus ehimensis]
MYTQEQIDYVHDVLIDLMVSCMRSGHIPYEEPKIGDWCIELSNNPDESNRDTCIGKLIRVIADGEYEIETVGKKIVTWRNAIMSKIPDKYLRTKNAALFN